MGHMTQTTPFWDKFWIRSLSQFVYKMKICSFIHSGDKEGVPSFKIRSCNPYSPTLWGLFVMHWLVLIMVSMQYLPLFVPKIYRRSQNLHTYW